MPAASGALVGGLYGVSIGAAFFGESMFSRETDASKVALVHLVARLRLGGYRLLDTQFLTPHLAQFGGIEISRARYHRLLASALAYRASFPVDCRNWPAATRWHSPRPFAVEQDDVVDRVFQRRQRRALGEHPAAEPPDVFLARTHLVDLQKRRASGRSSGGFFSQSRTVIARLPNAPSCRPAP